MGSKTAVQGSVTAPCKILIINDDIDDVDILADAFKDSGVESVHYVYTAMEAFMYLEMITEKQDLPRLIVTDMHLPGISGLEFLNDLKSMELYKHIHVIVLTSDKRENEIARARQLGVLDYVIKPFTYNDYRKVAEDISRKANL